MNILETFRAGVEMGRRGYLVVKKMGVEPISLPYQAHSPGPTSVNEIQRNIPGKNNSNYCVICSEVLIKIQKKKS